MSTRGFRYCWCVPGTAHWTFQDAFRLKYLPRITTTAPFNHQRPVQCLSWSSANALHCSDKETVCNRQSPTIVTGNAVARQTHPTPLTWATLSGLDWGLLEMKIDILRKEGMGHPDPPRPQIIIICNALYMHNYGRLDNCGYTPPTSDHLGGGQYREITTKYSFCFDRTIK